MRSTRLSRLQTNKFVLISGISLLKTVLFATNQEKILQWKNNRKVACDVTDFAPKKVDDQKL